MITMSNEDYNAEVDAIVEDYVLYLNTDRMLSRCVDLSEISDRTQEEVVADVDVLYCAEHGDLYETL